MEIKKIYAYGQISAEIGLCARIQTPFGAIRTSIVKSMAITANGNGLLVTENSVYEIVRLDTRKKAHFANSATFAEVGEQAIVHCNGNAIRTSTVVAVMEDQYAKYIETRNSYYIVTRSNVKAI